MLGLVPGWGSRDKRSACDGSERLTRLIHPGEPRQWGKPLAVVATVGPPPLESASACEARNSSRFIDGHQKRDQFAGQVEWFKEQNQYRKDYIEARQRQSYAAFRTFRMSRTEVWSMRCRCVSAVCPGFRLPYIAVIIRITGRVVGAGSVCPQTNHEKKPVS